MPGGPFTPPPCRRCGSTGDYYSAGLCRRCHYHAPQRVDSCRDCHAWGATRTHKWLCWPCANWRATYPAVAPCLACDRTLAVNRHGVCRLCRVEARRIRTANMPLDYDIVRRQGAQLFLADMHKARTRRRRLPDQGSARPPWPTGRPVTWRQLVLFDLVRDLSPGRAVVGPPRDPELAAALEAFTNDYAARAGWDRKLATRVRSGIRLLLGMQDTPGAPITVTETAVLRQVHLQQRPILDVLAEAGMLEDDRTPAIERWFAQHTQHLPAAMRDELRVWFEIVLHGSASPPRRKPRSISIIRLYLRAVLPIVATWADNGHQSLREISRDHVLAVLPASGRVRSETGQALRSIFEILKNRKLVFQNPVARIHTWADDRPLPLPADTAPIRDALNSTNPARAALAALAAFHGLRTGQIRDLHLTDIRDGKVHLDRRVIPLADPVRQRITAWLNHRHARWPTATNPHLFVNLRNAHRAEPVGYRWIRLTLNLPGGAQTLRRDRIVDEVLATRGDARRLSDLFGISIQTATHYTDIVGHPDLDRETSNFPE